MDSRLRNNKLRSIFALALRTAALLVLTMAAQLLSGLSYFSDKEMQKAN